MLRTPVAFAFLAAVAGFHASAGAADVRSIESVPHLDASGRDAYRAFLDAGHHRAFAVAPGGAWSWNGDSEDSQSAANDALEGCQLQSHRRCILYALDDRVVFDRSAWARLWGPYPDERTARQAAFGVARGERFHDLSFTTAAGERTRLSDLRGNVVVLHFWGSWCPPCRRELPELQRLHDSLRQGSGIRIVLLQVREGGAAARAWARREHLRLPIYDSGAAENSELLPLADGKALHDRAVAEVFPTTYVLDRYGVVVFSHVGPIARWPEYLPLLRDVAERSGR